MAIIKCKMCGGDLHPEEGITTCECEFCGTVQTIPTEDGDKKTNLFNRANRLRMNAEFDKAGAVYESIAAEFPEEAEAYWGICLCKYGIEYVDDPLTGSKIPTCHRTLPESILDDDDFSQACENASPDSKRLYREEAKAIDRLQQDILSIVANEAPYDVFICYKETDENGERTPDSVMAQDIYDELTKKGLKVFFSRITLEDKLGQQYEPYIYAALHSSRVMLSIGTSYDYFDAVWVKNEWARFLELMKTDRQKTLIPCYKGIDAYDMPREFNNLQAQDMGKLGWLQDLVRGVEKLCGKGAPAQTEQQAQPVQTSALDSAMKCAHVFLTDHEWDKAKEYFEKALDIDAEYAPAYVGMVLARHEIESEERLKQIDEDVLTNDQDWEKALRYASIDEKPEYERIASDLSIRAEYKTASDAESRGVYARACSMFDQLGDYVDSRQRTLACAQKWLVTRYDKKFDMNLRVLQEEIDYQMSILKENNARKKERMKYIQREQQRRNEYVDEQQRIKGLFVAGKKKELQWLIEKQDSIIDTARNMIAEFDDKIAEAQSIIASYEESIAKTKAEADKYKESAAQALNEEEQKQLIERTVRAADNLATSRNGETYIFGRYKQDNGSGDDVKPIEWIVLENDGETITLISKYGLDAMPYNKENVPITWDGSSLRSWLNNDFYDVAFSEDEKDRIEITNLINSSAYNYKRFGGENTNDKVYLLSIDEFNVLMTDDSIKCCQPTEYAKKVGAYIKNDKSWWWLRSPGSTQRLVAQVRDDGVIDTVGRNVYNNYNVVRPVIRVNLY